MNELPILYSTNTSGKQIQWRVWVEDDIVYKEYGQVGGKLQINNRSCIAKNVGRSNETTADEQALIEAKRSWVSQLQKGYKPSDKDKNGMKMYNTTQEQRKIDGGLNINANKLMIGESLVKTGEERNVSLDSIAPMLAQTFDESSKCVKYFNFNEGVYVDPKYDGIRAVIRILDGKVYITSRRGKIITHFPHIEKSSAYMLNGHEDIILDGELYAHKIYNSKGKRYSEKERFDIISSACSVARKNKFVFESTQIGFLVYDIIDVHKTQEERWKLLQKIYSNNDGKNIISCVDRREVHSVQEIYNLHKLFVNQGFEGVMIRAKEGEYKLCPGNKRSSYLRKYKEFQDEEFKVIGVHCDPGVGEENFVWICTTEDGNEFKAKPEGEVDSKLEWYRTADEKIGQMLTVTFQSKSKDGIPRFPVAKGFRDE